MRKILIVGLALIGLLGVGWVFANNALATEDTAGTFDNMRQERLQYRQEQMEAGLDEAVGDGVITAEQKQTLLNKRAEMQERREQLREEMRAWMDENGFDCEALAPYRAGYGGRGPDRTHGFGRF